MCITDGQFVVLFLQCLTSKHVKLTLHFLHLAGIDEFRIHTQFPLFAIVDVVGEPLTFDPWADVITAIGCIDGITTFVVIGRRDVLQPLDGLIPLAETHVFSTNEVLQFKLFRVNLGLDVFVEGCLRCFQCEVEEFLQALHLHGIDVIVILVTVNGFQQTDGSYRTVFIPFGKNLMGDTVRCTVVETILFALLLQPL